MVPEHRRAKTRVDIFVAHHPALHTLDVGGRMLPIRMRRHHTCQRVLSVQSR